MKQLGDILLEGGLVTQTQLDAAFDEQERVGRAPRPGPGRAGRPHRVPARRGARHPDRPALRRPVATTRSTAPPSAASPAPSAAGTPRCRSASRTASCSSPWPTRPTSSPSTTSARSPAWTSSRSSRPAPTSPPRSTATTAPTPTSTTSQPSWTRQDEEDDLSKVKEIVEDAPIVKYVNLLITQAIQDRASDIHLEPTETRPAGALPHRRRAARGDALAQGDPDRRHQPPEDHGRHQHRRAPDPAGRPALGQRTTASKIDLRVATLPTVWGEKVVMRILDNSTARLDLTDLGFSDDNYERYSRELHQALRDDPGHRADRLRQVDDALRDAEHRQPARGQRHHRRGPGRVPAARASTRCRPTPRPA